MKTYAQIENGKVVNTIVASDEFASQQGWVLCEYGGIGWDYIDNEFVDNRPQLEVVIPVVPTKEELLAQLNTIAAQIQTLS